VGGVEQVAGIAFALWMEVVSKFGTFSLLSKDCFFCGLGALCYRREWIFFG
jgi:hypothetical protein